MNRLVGVDLSPGPPAPVRTVIYLLLQSKSGSSEALQVSTRSWPFRTGRSRPQGARCRNDSASMHVLEAVIVATIMISAVAYVATFESPPRASTPSRDILQQKTDDALNILYDTPVFGEAKGDNQLSVYLVECMAGDCQNLTEKLDKLIPEGASYALYVSNGYDTYPVYVVREPGGEAVTSTHLLEPKWSHSFVATQRNNVNPVTDPLMVYSLPVFNGNVINEGGSPLRVMAYGTRLSDGSNYTLMGNYATQALATEDADQTSAVSLNFLVPFGEYDVLTQTFALEDWIIGGIANYHYWTIDAAGSPTYDEQPFYVRVENTGEKAIPAGTEIEITVPRGWKATADQATNDPRWKVLANATNGNGTRDQDVIQAVLLSDIATEAVQFEFSATYYGDVLNWYPFSARLSKGALAQASLLVQSDDNSDQTQVLRPPGVRMSVPRPMGGGTTTTWTVVVDVPFTVGSNTNFHLGRVNKDSAETVVLFDRIEIVEQNGAAIFGSTVTGITSADKNESVTAARGLWTSYGNKLVWRATDADEQLQSDFGPFSLSFTVSASGTEGSQDKREPFTPPADFNELTGRLTSQTAAGFYSEAFLPEVLDPGELGVTIPWKGYDTSATPPADFDVHSDSLYRTTLLPGSVDYAIETVPSPTDAMFGSYVSVDTPVVPIGEEVVLNVDVQSMLFALADAGQEAGVTVHFYPPWAGTDREPIHTIENLDSGLLNSEVTAMTAIDVNGDAIADPVIGTSNGRVIAIDAVSGARVAEKIFIVPVHETVDADGKTVASPLAAVTHLERATIGGVSHLVVGTAENGGIYVIGLDFKQKWSYSLPAYETVTLRADTDFDADGDPEILATVRKPADATQTFHVYVLTIPASGTTLDPVLPTAEFEPALGTNVIIEAGQQAADAFFTWMGDPSALVGMDGIGLTPTKQGFAVSLRTLAGVDAQTDFLATPSLQTLAETKFTVATPRHGLIGLDEDGHEAFTFFGSPVTAAEPFDHDGDGVTDVVAGSPAGFVYALNGVLGAQPAYPILYPGAIGAEDAECIDGLRCVVLTMDGTPMFTTDGFATRFCISCDPATGIGVAYPEATSVSINGTASFWLAGTHNLLWRTVENPSPEHQGFAWLEPLPVLDIERLVAGIPEPLDIEIEPVNFYDVHFLKDGDGETGWAVGGALQYPRETPCTTGASCPDSVILMTTDGGDTWHSFTHDASGSYTMQAADGSRPTSTLLRINFTTRDVGWIVGTGGTLLLTVDGGLTWKGVETGLDKDLADIACAPGEPDVCMLVGADGTAMLLEDGTTGDPRLTDMTERLGAAAATRDLLSVGMLDTERAYVGTKNMILQTFDRGGHWTQLPMNYIESDGARIQATPDGFAYVFGGNETSYRVFHVHDFLPEATFRTTEAMPFLDPGDRLIDVEIEIVRDIPATGDLDLYVSADGGSTWTSFDFLTGRDDIVVEHGMERRVYVEVLTATIPEAFGGHDVRFRADLSTATSVPVLTPVLRQLRVTDLRYEDETGEDQTAGAIYSLDLSTSAQMDAAQSTAVIDTAERAVRLPVLRDLWTTNVSGEVNDLIVGPSVVGDARADAWVATGSVLSGNSPDYALYAGSDQDVVMGVDNQVYLIDGENGAIVATSGSLGGEVRELALSDVDGDGDPEALFATVYVPSGTTGSSRVYELDPITLVQRWMHTVEDFEPVTLAAGEHSANLPAAFLGTKQVETGSVALPGRITALTDGDSKKRWSTIPDERGRYLLNHTLPLNWLFGPYVVEVVVDWRDQVTGEDGLSREVLQAARFYDYFMVTPPGSLSPPSPVYNVHLVTWFNDWR